MHAFLSFLGLFSLLVASTSGKLIEKCSKKGHIALTFDDGPFYYGQQIAKSLEANNSTGTFFVNGFNYGCIYDRADDLLARYKAGHLIGSHTFSHPDISQITDAELIADVIKLEVALKKILGIRPKYFRAPFGNLKDNTVKLLETRGYRVIGWDSDTNDWRGYSEATIRKQTFIPMFKKAASKSFLVLSHETRATTRTAIAKVVPRFISEGWKVGTVADCLGDSQWYYDVGPPGVRDSTWTCAQ